MVIRDFKVGDILICKKDSLIIKDEIWYWRPDMDIQYMGNMNTLAMMK